ncbi:hypothetical protein SCLCIDRAFT_856828 [Scleroderma citrinum Foug A]|uniref:Uncharacterized protein n=1 Tax=Scleroderma citrinum Foug A TaxID=1036808 RepID=A0A0C2ZJQ6_9AGAM|nr:hypothetical protein SCLCIDRAFT_856828 [Scleroderma citrinum Foug A]
MHLLSSLLYPKERNAFWPTAPYYFTPCSPNMKLEGATCASAKIGLLPCPPMILNRFQNTPFIDRGRK